MANRIYSLIYNQSLFTFSNVPTDQATAHFSWIKSCKAVIDGRFFSKIPVNPSHHYYPPHLTSPATHPAVVLTSVQPLTLIDVNFPSPSNSSLPIRDQYHSHGHHQYQHTCMYALWSPFRNPYTVTPSSNHHSPTLSSLHTFTAILADMYTHLHVHAD